MRRRNIVIAAVMVAVTCSACAGAAGDSAGRGPPVAGTAAQTLFINCSGCHDGTTAEAGGLDMTSPRFPLSLVGTLATGSKCGETGRVVIDSDGSGLLMNKLRASPPCGDRMPQGTYPLTESEIVAVGDWLRQTLAPPQ